MNNLQRNTEKYPKPEEVLARPELQPYEWERCRRDSWYFMTRWCKTKDQNYNPSVRDFPQFPYLKRLNDIVDREKMLLIEKSRRMFITWLFLCRMVHACIFKENQFIAIQSLNRSSSRDLLGKNSNDKLTFLLKQLPDFFFHFNRPSILVDHVYFGNGSYISAIPQGDHQLRQYTCSWWFCDEGAEQEELENALAGAKPTLEGGGKVAIVSTTAPSYFHELVIDEQDFSIDDKILADGRAALIDGKELVVESKIEVEDKGKEIIEVVPGFQEWRNIHNGFYVIRLYYWADERKDPKTEEGKKWKEEAIKGLKGKNWNQEYEIDSTAKADSLVYPEFDLGTHVIDVDIKDIPEDWTRYHTLDEGLEAPTAALWGAVTPSGDLVIYDEYYVKGRDVSENAAAMCQREIEDHPGLPVIGKLDPHDFVRSLQTKETVATLYASLNRFYTPANNDIKAGVELVKMYLSNATRGEHPAIYFLPHLMYLFKEIRNYKMDGKTDKPKVKQRDDIMDCLKYMVTIPPTYMGEVIDGPEFVQIRDSLTGYLQTYAVDKHYDPRVASIDEDNDEV